MFAHCNSTLAFASSKVERFVLFVGDQAPRSSEQDEALPSRPSTASQDKADRSKRTKPVAQRGFVAFFVRLAPMKTAGGHPSSRHPSKAIPGCAAQRAPMPMAFLLWPPESAIEKQRPTKNTSNGQQNTYNGKIAQRISNVPRSVKPAPTETEFFRTGLFFRF